MSGNSPMTVQLCAWLTEYRAWPTAAMSYVSPRQSLTQLIAPVFGSAAKVPSKVAPEPNA